MESHPTTPRPTGPAGDVVAAVRRLVERADEHLKAASNRPDPTLGWERAEALLDEADALRSGVADPATRDDLVVLIGRRRDDLAWAVRTAGSPASDPVDRRHTPTPQPGPDTLARPRPDDPRLPVDQRLVTTFPVLHVGATVHRTREEFVLVVSGLVAGRRHRLSFDDLRAIGEVDVTADFHCVTGWSRYDNRWTGVRVSAVLDHLGVDPAATHLVCNGANAYSANLDLPTARRDDVLLAWAHDGAPLTDEHGGPVRLVVPSRYAWKSVKWVESLQLFDRDVPGYWEARGYHNVADPWLGQRYA
ncbi:MAG: molybdopterin-dependent oxidoreductase [Actinomycetes bacterium]